MYPYRYIRRTEKRIITKIENDETKGAERMMKKLFFFPNRLSLSSPVYYLTTNLRTHTVRSFSTPTRSERRTLSTGKSENLKTVSHYDSTWNDYFRASILLCAPSPDDYASSDTKSPTNTKKFVCLLGVNQFENKRELFIPTRNKSAFLAYFYKKIIKIHITIIYF